MEVQINFLAVFLAGVASMFVGFLWYGPYLFGNAWMKLMGHKEMTMDKSGLGKIYFISFLLSLLTAVVLTHSIAFGSYYMKISGVSAGVQGAFWSWLGFVMPVQATDVLFGGKSWKLSKINTGYQLASLLAMGAVLGYFG